MLDYSKFFSIPSIEFGAIAPILTVVITGIVALLVEMARPPGKYRVLVSLVSEFGLIVAGVLLLLQFSQAPSETVGGMMACDHFSVVMQFLVVISCLFCVAFSESYLRQKRIPFGEFYPLVLWSSSGAMLMASSKNLLVIFLGLEVLSIAIYVMAGMSRSEEKSEESAVKYLLLGAFASGFLLYGIAMLYGASGSLRIDDIAAAWASNNGSAQTLLLFGLALVLVGLSFKSAFVPFHQWTPDVYQGAPTNVTAFMASVSKIGAIAALWRVLDASGVMAHYWIPAMAVVAVLTMTVGNLVALMQKDVKRILGYSSIAHAGYILVAILAHGESLQNPFVNQIGFGTTAYYLLSYSIMTIGAFAVVSLVAKGGHEKTNLEDLHGLYRRDPFAAVILVIFMASLIGIPPTSGFIGKLFIFNDAVSAHLSWLAIILAANSIISIAYYLAIAKAAFIDEEGAERTIQVPMTRGSFIAGALCAACVFLVAIFASPILLNMQDINQGTGMNKISRPVALRDNRVLDFRF